MTTTQSNRQVLTWLGEGKKVQMKTDPDTWADLESVLCSDGWKNLCTGMASATFRIKPRTVKIGNREVEAPVLEPVAGQELWVWSFELEQAKPVIAFNYNLARQGRYFCSPGDCCHAHHAITALLRGES